MDKYVTVKKIGEGSFGKAILVKSKSTGEQYVVKEIGISKMKPKEKSEARKEVTVLSKMRHPNIVQYTESFEENGHLYIVMEYCEGGDLYALINKQKSVPFSEQKVLSWFVQLCLALKHVHDRKILHRDIKSSNIFLTKTGTIKLGDFGIARVLNNTMELAKTCIGTPYYLSPEICENKPYNNKSDVWALGCVVYETLTLKHAFEAGNMKNLVLKIIRGSYPPVPSRYSYELRTLVSHLFRRNPRERPSINSILRKPFLSHLTEQFLSPKQHEEEFSHTVLHNAKHRPSNDKPSHIAPRYQPIAAKRMQNLEVRGGAFGVRNRRDQQIAAAYGPSVAVKKPKPAASRVSKASQDRTPDDYLEKKRKQLIEEEKRRKDAINEEKKKRLEDLQKRQRERAMRMKEDQLKRARDEARMFNLKRSAELMEPKANGEPDANFKKKAVAAAPRARPVSAPRIPGDYEKYHQYLNKLEKGEKRAAAELAAPGLNRVREAWEERQKGQAAVLMAAQVNRAVGEKAAERAHIVSEYLQRKQEAMLNKNRGNKKVYHEAPVREAKVGVSAALRPYSAASNKEDEERQYLSKLQQIRQQNYNERKNLHKKFVSNKDAYKVEIPESDELSEVDEGRKKKVIALQQQAADRAKILQENMEKRRDALDVNQNMKKHDAKARARGILPPDERPVKYNPNPISVTQALHAVGAPVPKKEDPEIPDEMLSPSRADPVLRKKILQRVNQRFSVDFEQEEKREANKENKTVENKDEPKDEAKEVGSRPRPLPELPEKHTNEPQKKSAWHAKNNQADIVNEISGLPLQETTTLLAGTNAPTGASPQLSPAVKRQWKGPSGTFVRQLNQMEIQNPTMTMANNTRDEVPASAPPERPLPSLNPDKSQSTTQSRQLPETKPEVDDKTIVIGKNPPSDSKVPPPDGKVSENILAANFRPPKQLGTYVIKSLDQSEAIERKEANKRTESEVKSKVSSQVQVESSPVVSSQVPDDVELVECGQEVKTNVKGDSPLTAWSENPSSKSEVSPKKSQGSSPEKLEGASINQKELLKKGEETPIKSPKPQEKKSEESQNPSVETPKKPDDKMSKQSHPPVKSDNSPSNSKKPQLTLPRPSLSPKPALSALSPTQSTHSSYSQDTLKLSTTGGASTQEKDATQGTSSSPVSNPPVPAANGSPLFTKVTKTKHAKSFTTPNPPIDKLKTSVSTPLSKSLYSTASDEMLLKLTLGCFDSPNPKLLRTCSLPDLQLDVTEEKEDTLKQEDDDEMKEISVMSSMNDTNFDEDEDVVYEVMRVGPQEEDSDEDDELNAFRANLQSVLDNSSKPDSSSFPSIQEYTVDTASDDDSSTSPSNEDPQDRTAINEDWQSDDDSYSSSEEDDISDTESVFSRLEDNREELERELGLERFLKAYRYVQASHEDEDEELQKCQDRVRSVLGDRHDALYPKILQLVMADGAYCEDNC